MKLKMKSIKMYQSVEFNKKQQTSFTLKAFNPGAALGTRPGVEVKESERGYLIYDATDCIEVFPTNISHIQYEIEQEVAPDSTAKPAKK